MIITGTIVNVLAVLAGSALGLLFHTRLPQRFVDILFQAIGLFTLALGIKMALGGQMWMLIVLSLIAGALFGELLKLEVFFDGLASRLAKRLRIGSALFNEGLLTAFLLYCMGSMTVLGAIEEGMGGKPDLYYLKSVMDGISSVALASGLGIGVMFSAVPLFVYQAGLTLLAFWFGTFFPESLIAEVSAVGGILLIGLGLNILKIAQIKMLNLLPALAFAALFGWLALEFGWAL